MAATVLMVLSAGLLLAIGLLHLVYTFHGPKLRPRDRSLQIRMDEVSPVITRETTMWRCWLGFNVTHSMCLMLFGLVYGFLAIFHASVLFASAYLLGVGLLLVGGMVALSKAYFFRSPFVAVSTGLVLYVASFVAAMVQGGYVS